MQQATDRVRTTKRRQAAPAARVKPPAGIAYPVRPHPDANGFLVDAEGTVLGSMGGGHHTHAQERELAEFAADAMNAAAADAVVRKIARR